MHLESVTTHRECLCAQYGSDNMARGIYDRTKSKPRPKHSEATKLKMSLASKGKPKSASHREALSVAKIHNPTRYWLGKKRPDVSGANSWKWRKDRNAVLEKHRVRGSLDWKQWRASVFARDNFTCKECGVRGVYIEPHHIIPIRSNWNKLFDLNNGITLCRPCHKKTMWKEEDFADKYSALLSIV